MKAFWKQFYIEFKLHMREPEAVFWGFVFPVIMVIILGLLFNKKNKEPEIILIGVEQNLFKSNEFREIKEEINKNKLIKLIEISEQDKLIDFKTGKYHLVFNLRQSKDNMELVVQYPSIAEKDFEKDEKIIDQLIQSINFNALKSKDISMPFIKITEKVIVKGEDGQDISYIDWLLPGVVGLNLFISCAFGIGITVVQDKKNGKYKKIATTPLPSWQFMLTMSLQRMVILYLQAIVILIAGYLIFNIKPAGRIIDYLLFLTISIFCFMLFGFAIASVCKTIEKAVAISNVVFILSMLLSGAYFSNSGLPNYLKILADLMPSSLCVEATRGIYTYGKSIFEYGYQLLFLILWSIVCLLFSVKYFRWTND